jgi:RNA polymerase-binding transcription factor DksA
MHNRLNQVLEALDRIAAGTYGICILCRGPIPFERLEVIPETGTCVRCGGG